jgi:hypothetical protein
VAEEEVEEETDFAKLAMKKLMPKAAKGQYQEYTTAVAFCRTQGIYSIGGLAKLISLRCSKWPSTISVSQLPAVRLSKLSAAANIQSLTTDAA